MSEWITGALAAWREVLHVSEWTGLSIGALVAIAFAVYLDPRLLRPAIIAAIGIGLVYVGMLYGDKTGRADVEAQWSDARKAAVAADQARDAMIEQQLEATFQPKLAQLQKQADERKSRSDAYEKQILALLAKSPAAGRCELGDAANRMRRPK